MARHSDGKQNWSLTPAAWAVVIAVIVLFIGGGWAIFRALSPGEQCGTIKVALAEPSLLDDLRTPLSDSCIDVTSVPTEDADAYLGPDTRTPNMFWNKPHGLQKHQP